MRAALRLDKRAARELQEAKFLLAGRGRWRESADTGVRSRARATARKCWSTAS